MLTIFVDTNFFIQCKDIGQIRWDLLAHENLTIIIPLTVVRQLDSFKTDGNRRRSGRAKKILPFIKELSKGANHCLKYKRSTINFMIAERFPAGPPKNDILDLTDSDDKIINEILSWCEFQKNTKVFLLTDDAGVHITCSQCGIECLDIPKEWFLPPEPDNLERQIKALIDEVNKLKENSAKIEISLANDSGKDALAREIRLYDDLSWSKIEEFVSHVKNNATIAVNLSPKFHEANSTTIIGSTRSSLNLRNWVRPSDRALDEYQNKLSEWAESVSLFFETLAEKLNAYAMCMGVPIHITNTGVRPAEEAIVNFELFGDFEFTNTDSPACHFKPDDDFKIPSPPDAPSGRFINVPTSIFALNEMSNAERFKFTTGLLGGTKCVPFDPCAFYKRDAKDKATCQRYHAKEFRHETDEVFHLKITPKYNDKECKGILKCSLSARNLKKAALFELNLRVSFKRGDIECRAREFLSKTEKVGWIIGCNKSIV